MAPDVPAVGTRASYHGHELVSLRAARFSNSFLLPEGGRVVVGRSADANVQIYDVSLSRLHCMFEREHGKIFLVDLGSSNGTWINGQRISRQALRQGDSVRLGNVEFQFHCEKATGVVVPVGDTPTILAGVGRHVGDAMKLFPATVGALVGALEARDRYTHGHSARVTQYALTIGRGLLLTAENLAILELAGILHDIGKVGIPDSILRKPGPLSPEEYDTVKQHPLVGYRILSQVEGTEAIAEIVLHHHERWDGKGYPRGISGEKISLAARILAVADCFDAMGSDRPYRPAFRQVDAMEEIARCAGTQLDRKVVEVFLEQAKSGAIAVERDMVQRVTMQERLPQV